MLPLHSLSTVAILAQGKYLRHLATASLFLFSPRVLGFRRSSIFLWPRVSSWARYTFYWVCDPVWETPRSEFFPVSLCSSGKKLAGNFSRFQPRKSAQSKIRICQRLVWVSNLEPVQIEGEPKWASGAAFAVRVLLFGVASEGNLYCYV